VLLVNVKLVSSVRIILVWLLYQVGHMISWLLYFDCLAWLYPVYSRLMTWSSDIDNDNIIWHEKNDEEV